MDFSDIKFFGGHTERLLSRDYTRSSSFNDEIRFYFRVQGALTLGELETGIFSTGQWGDYVKSDWIQNIEEQVAHALGIPLDKVTVKGTRSMPETSDRCQGDTLSPLFDI